MTPPLSELWVYLSATPLLFLTLTLVVYQGAYWLYRRAGFHPLLNPLRLVPLSPWSTLALRSRLLVERFLVGPIPATSLLS